MQKRCPIEFTLSLLNGKWRIIILKELSQAPLRYGELNRSIEGISDKVLIQQLREMEEAGLLVRTVFPEVPARVEYALSDMGSSIFSIFLELRRWGLEVEGEHQVECSFCGKCQPFIAG